jgi:cytochrome c oxidase cbb3-type subunit I
MSSTSPTDPVQAAPACPVPAASQAEIDASCRWPVLLLFFSAVAWLTLGSIFSLLVSVKMHAPGMMADAGWLTYGRLQAAGSNLFLYGFGIPAGLGMLLWMFARLGATRVVWPSAALAGTAFWNLGVLLGLVQILAGGNTGYEWLEIPRGATLILFTGYLLIGVTAMLTFMARTRCELYVSQWFLLAALFWFPWVLSTASLLLQFQPPRGALQAVVHLWYGQNLSVICLGFIGLAATFYFIPKFIGKPLHSRYSAMLAFWMLAFFGAWGGIHPGAPVPAWMPSVSTVGTVLLIVPLLALAGNWHQTLSGAYRMWRELGLLRVVIFAAIIFLVTGLLRIALAFPPVSDVLEFTYFTTAVRQLHLYGFFALTMFVAIYYILPRVTGLEMPSAKLVKVHLFCAVAGILVVAISLLAAGVMQGTRLADPAQDFNDVMKATMMIFRLSTLGDLLLVMAHIALLANFKWLLFRGCCAGCCPARDAGPTTEGVKA